MRRAVFMLCLQALLASGLHARPGFEGIVQSRNRTADDAGVMQEYRMTLWVRDAMVRVHVPAAGAMPASTAIYRRDRNVSWILDDAERTYFEVALSGGRDPAESLRPGGQGGEPVDIQRPKGTRKILGYTCERVIIVRGEIRTELWAARGLEDLVRMMKEAIDPGAATGAEDVVAGMGLFPLHSTTTFEGRVLEEQEVVKIERTKVDRSLFEIPAGYIKQRPPDVE